MQRILFIETDQFNIMISTKKFKILQQQEGSLLKPKRRDIVQGYKQFQRTITIHMYTRSLGIKHKNQEPLILLQVSSCIYTCEGQDHGSSRTIYFHPNISWTLLPLSNSILDQNALHIRYIHACMHTYIYHCCLGTYIVIFLRILRGL